jgi:serine-type D-Ala-D-Ala carboxypeptidase/endopeptidase (penicillin-binding protein 4)
VLFAVLAVGALVVTACSSASPARGPSGPAPVGALPKAAQQVMDKPAYKTARWGYLVSDLKTGKVLYSSQPDQLAFTGSTAKLFTIGALFDGLGPNTRLTTPVYEQGSVTGGVLTGNLDLVGSGDITFGGREADQGKAVNSFSATTQDHVYGDVAPHPAIPKGDPLAGLNSLAKQVAAKGITRVQGNVVVDDRLWDPYSAQEGPVPPIYVNDNLFDITVTPGSAAGQPATIAGTPQTKAFTIDSTVRTVGGSDADLSVAADESNPHLLHVTGTIGASGGPRLKIYRIPDAASWARTLFIEALNRAGVQVSANPNADNNPAGLPAKGSYSAAQQVAAYRSPPLSTLAGFVMESSYNTGANDFLCLVAVHAGSTDCHGGIKAIHAMLTRAKLNQNQVILVDGQGGDPASTNAEQMVTYLRWVVNQSWGKAFQATLPVLGETGTLAASGRNSPARGKVDAKTGTSAAGDPGTGRALFNIQALGGYMTTRNGERLVFDLWVSGATFSDPFTGIEQIGDDVGDVAAAFQQAVK